jgi:hypothetical protein
MANAEKGIQDIKTHASGATVEETTPASASQRFQPDRVRHRQFPSDTRSIAAVTA